MANANFDSTSITSKAVSLVVAIVVFVCVLVPVVGSMADDGGNGGSEDTPHPTLMNEGIPYASMDSNTHTMRIQLVDSDFILTVDGQQIDVGFGYVPWDDENPPTELDNMTLVTGYQGDYPVFFILDMNGGIGSSDYNFYIDMSESSDVTLTITGTGVTHNSEEFSMNVEYYISTSGDYVMTENPNIYSNTEFGVWYMDSQKVMKHNVTTDEGEVIDDSIVPMEGWPLFFGEGYVATITSALGWEGAPYVNPTLTVNTTESEGYIILNSIQIDDSETLYGKDGTVTESEWTMYARLFLVPKAVTYSDEPVTYTNHGDMYFAKADADSVQHTISITLGKYDDMTLIVDGQTLSDFAQSKVSVFAYGSVFLCKIWMEEDDEHDMNYKLVWIDADNNITLIKPTSSTSTDLGYIESETYQFTIQNGKLSWTDESDQTRETPIDIYISSTGEYVLATDPNYTPLVGKNTDIYVYFRYADISDMPELPPNGDLYHNVTVVGGFNTSVLTSDSVEVDSILFETESTNLHTVVHPLISGSAVNPNMMTVDATLIYENISYPNYELNPIRTFIIPVNVTFGDDADDGGSDGGSGNGNSPMVKTLIGIIPVFVALGLIIAVVSMFYNPNRMD